ncbi:Septin-domain-containing protein [Rhodocollybia butyracea]|uniref:Septin-domain-containing protein n=1 Tax=Rhodocollybia butyracea TaxID=206335 RepID=A0A9P5PQT8_9AGAR|nr:Septin-domain-containing protein [Rhodocollybia butyracea]
MPSNIAKRRRSKAKGVQFTVMVVVLPHKECDNPESAVVETGVSIKPVNVDIEEDGLRISLTIVDTPGFGDSVDNDLAFQEIVTYLERQYDDILAEQSRNQA